MNETLKELSAFNGRNVTLECQGHLPGNRFLDGLTQTGQVQLAPQSGGGYTGTIWELHFVDLDRGLAMFKCLGDIDGNRWLDGVTHTGQVQLAPTNYVSDANYSGTVWRMMRDPSGQWYLECQGDLDGRRFLDGLTQSNQVQLAPHTSGGYTGTRWIIRRV